MMAIHVVLDVPMAGVTVSGSAVQTVHVVDVVLLVVAAAVVPVPAK